MTSSPIFDFTGATVCVTGGTSGIGLGVATSFADAGAIVTITGTRSGASEYEVALDRFRYAQMNTRDAGSVEEVAASFTATTDGLDVLVNNAGANFPDGLDESTPEGFDAAVELNLLGGHRLIRSCHSLLKASDHPGGAAVINVASMAAFRPTPFVPGYGAAKAAVVQMTKQLGLMWPVDGIRVNAVAPGLTESNMTAPMKAMAEIEAAELAKVPMARWPDGPMARWPDGPMARWGTPADLTPVFLFLASPAAAFVTGQTWNVDGGYSLT